MGRRTMPNNTAGCVGCAIFGPATAFHHCLVGLTPSSRGAHRAVSAAERVVVEFLGRNLFGAGSRAVRRKLAHRNNCCTA